MINLNFRAIFYMLAVKFKFQEKQYFVANLRLFDHILRTVLNIILEVLDETISVLVNLDLNLGFVFAFLKLFNLF